MAIEFIILIVLVLIIAVISLFNLNTPHDGSYTDIYYKEIEQVKKYYEESRPDGLYLLDPVITNLDDLSFKEAFRIVRAVRGNNATFYWKGKQFNTNKE